MIVSITGPSGAGKTTLLHNLLASLPQAQILTSITTRAPRPTDEPGEYEYVSQEEFDALSQAGEFLWEVHPHGKSYATKKSAMDRGLLQGLYLPVLVVDAVAKLHAYAKEKNLQHKVVSFYILINDEAELRRRFEERNDMTEKEIESRLVECRSWNERARTSGVPFVYLAATKTPEEIVRDALAHLPR